ncbi:hypothetical protein ACFQMA_07975 [Halosimplex aquaticum]|uniref:Restriction endonuclease n=1 Tax=Halosimplex aquaticum TaxID=3026162 RepID=A0ABD5Y1K9_9EURY|nr:hypothetical protein [Halosimplex aquaticum]
MSSETDFSVYRLKIQPGGAIETANPYEFCKGEGIVGVGWGYNPAVLLEDGEIEKVDEMPDTESAVDRHNEIEQRFRERKSDDYAPSRVKLNGDLKSSLRYMIEDIEKGDFLWVNEGSEFALCKVTGDWETDLDLSAEKQDEFESNDIRNFREADWEVVPYPMVPGFVKRRFAGQGNTLSQMHIEDSQKLITEQIFAVSEFDDATEGLSAAVSDQLRADVTASQFLGILDPAEIEDIVLLKLQAGKGDWSIIKSTTSSSEADIECELRRIRDDEVERAFVQVKSGNASVSEEEYVEKAEYGDVFFFAEEPIDVGQHGNMFEISPDEVFEFAKEQTGLLPDSALLKLNAYL